MKFSHILPYLFLSSFLLWLGWPPFQYTNGLLLIALVPLLLGLEKIIRSDLKSKGKKIFFAVFITGFIWNTASIYWVYNSLAAVMPAYAALPISLIPFGLAPLLMGLTGSLYYYLRKKTAIYWALFGFFTVWLAYEYLHQSWDLAFPWMTLGNGFASSIEWVQWYEFTGVYGGTLWIWLINSLVFLLVLCYQDKIKGAMPIAFGTAIVLFISFPITWSIIKYNGYEERLNPTEVVVVQPNVDPYDKFGSASPESQVENLISLSESVAKPNTEFFIWPETAIPHPFGYDENNFRDHFIFKRLQGFLNPYKNGNILSGIESYVVSNTPNSPTMREFDGLYYDNFNAVVRIENSADLAFYHKSKLVPGVEQLPFSSALSFMKPLFKAFGGTTGGYGKQDEPSVLYAQSGIGAAPVICYESIWGAYVAEYSKKGAQFIAIVTNDGWWGNTSGKDQHFDYARLRAVENRKWVARSANTGISGFINQRGEIVQKTEWWVPTALTQEINLNEDLTFYVENGDWIVKISLFFGGLFILFTFLKPFLGKKSRN